MLRFKHLQKSTIIFNQKNSLNWTNSVQKYNVKGENSPRFLSVDIKNHKSIFDKEHRDNNNLFIKEGETKAMPKESVESTIDNSKQDEVKEKLAIYSDEIFMKEELNKTTAKENQNADESATKEVIREELDKHNEKKFLKKEFNIKKGKKSDQNIDDYSTTGGVKKEHKDNDRLFMKKKVNEITSKESEQNKDKYSRRGEEKELGKYNDKFAMENDFNKTIVNKESDHDNEYSSRGEELGKYSDIYFMKDDLNEKSVKESDQSNYEYLTTGKAEEELDRYNNKHFMEEESNRTADKEMDENYYARGEIKEELDRDNDVIFKESNPIYDEFLAGGEVGEVKVTVFDGVDQKNNTYFTRDEVKEAMLKEYGKVNDDVLDKIMSTDHGNFDKITPYQFEQQIAKLLMEDQIFQEEFPRRAFFDYDTNLDGMLNRKEISVVLKQLGENTDKARLKMFMKKYDKDKDGYLNYEEFCEFSKKELFPK